MSDTYGINAFIRSMENEAGLSPNTTAAYMTDLEQWYAPGSSLLEKLHTMSQAGLKPSTIRRKIMVLRAYYRWKGEASPDLDPPKRGYSLPKVATREEVKALLAGSHGEHGQALLLVLYSSGLRISELLALKWRDWYPAMSLLKVHGKGSKDRVVFVSPPAVAALEAWKQGYGGEYGGLTADSLIFRGTRKTVSDWLARLSQGAGIRHITPHMLRHAFATNMMENGANLLVIKELLGHESLNTTQNYTHVDAKRLRETHRKFHPRP